MPSRAAELRELPDDELLARVDAAKEELFNLRFQLATGQLDNPTRIREVRHDVARIAMTRFVKRGGKIWVRIFPDKPVTKKPAETRMGSGKGNPEGWVAVVKPGRVMFELAGVPESLARQAMLRAQHKLPIKTKFITRDGE